MNNFVNWNGKNIFKKHCHILLLLLKFQQNSISKSMIWSNQIIHSILLVSKSEGIIFYYYATPERTLWYIIDLLSRRTVKGGLISSALCAQLVTHSRKTARRKQQSGHQPAHLKSTCRCNYSIRRRESSDVTRFSLHNGAARPSWRLSFSVIEEAHARQRKRSKARVIFFPSRCKNDRQYLCCTSRNFQPFLKEFSSRWNDYFWVEKKPYSRS
jgi:hypothetical protein